MLIIIVVVIIFSPDRPAQSLFSLLLLSSCRPYAMGKLETHEFHINSSSIHDKTTVELIFEWFLAGTYSEKKIGV